MAKNRIDFGGLVFSTDPDYELPSADDDIEEMKNSEQSVRIWLDRKKRKGKEATLIKGFQATNARLKEIAKELKSKCGSGGSVVDGEILIQGDHRQKAKEYFEKIGVRDVKLAGG